MAYDQISVSEMTGLLLGAALISNTFCVLKMTIQLFAVSCLIGDVCRVQMYNTSITVHESEEQYLILLRVTI